MSPEWSQPSLTVWPVASGFRKYPFITFGPLIRISPSSPSGSSRPCSSTTFISTFSMGVPTAPGRERGGAGVPRQDQDVHRRDRVEKGDALPPDRPQKLLRDEALLEHEGAARVDEGFHDEVLAEAVEERQRAEATILGGHPEVVARRVDVGDDVRVRQHHALGTARGGGGVEDRRHLLPVEGQRPQRGVACEGGERNRSLARRADIDQVASGWQVTPGRKVPRHGVRGGGGGGAPG